MFHNRENLFFGRLPDGAVRILKFSANPYQGEGLSVDKRYHDVKVELDMTIPPNEWASIIATVSKSGEIDGGYYRALEFHQEPAKP